MKRDLKQKLLEMAKRDEQVRSDLLQRDLLFDGYHPEMEALHQANADCLERILRDHGWPTKNQVGEEAASAAWLIVQHAISKPEFQRSCLTLLKSEAEKGSIERKWVAHLQDRIQVFEGKPQTYGTQFEWDESGALSPNPIQDPQNVDGLRKNIGLPPLSDAIDQIRRRALREGNRAPKDHHERKSRFLKWAKRVGWRK